MTTQTLTVVVGVLLADGWHYPAKGSFALLNHGDDPWGEPTRYANPWPRAFMFKEEDGTTTSGPLTSVLAIREAQ